jgi:hypothetical protein
MRVIFVLVSICLLRMFYLQIPEGEFTAVGYAQRFEAGQGSIAQ